jgi:hypothetical protein
MAVVAVVVAVVAMVDMVDIVDILLVPLVVLLWLLLLLPLPPATRTMLAGTLLSLSLSLAAVPELWQHSQATWLHTVPTSAPSLVQSFSPALKTKKPTLGNVLVLWLLLCIPTARLALVLGTNV